MKTADTMKTFLHNLTHTTGESLSYAGIICLAVLSRSI